MKKLFALPPALLLVFSLAACGGTPDSGRQNSTASERITPAEQVNVESLTLLERTEYAFASDGEDAGVELYTSAAVAEDGQMGWDTGEQWTLLVRQGEQVFPLYDEYVQYGEVQFWISSLNPKDIDSPETEELEHHIYVAVTAGAGFTMYDYAWDPDDGCFQKSVLFSPEHQWNTVHSNKYTLFDASRIE